MEGYGTSEEVNYSSFLESVTLLCRGKRCASGWRGFSRILEELSMFLENSKYDFIFGNLLYLIPYCSTLA